MGARIRTTVEISDALLTGNGQRPELRDAGWDRIRELADDPRA